MSTFDVTPDDFFARETTSKAREYTSHVQAVVLDLAGVLLPTDLRYAQFARLFGRSTDFADRDAVKSAIWKHRRAYDLGQPPTEYWAAVAGELGAEDVDLTDLFQVEVDRWRSPLPDAIDLLDALEEPPVKVGVLANAPAPLARAFLDQDWAEVVDVAHFSASTGVLVPDERMFTLMERDLGVEPQGIVYFDNNPGHVEAAKAHGWDARVWEGGRAARHALMDLGVIH